MQKKKKKKKIVLNAYLTYGLFKFYNKRDEHNRPQKFMLLYIKCSYSFDG